MGATNFDGRNHTPSGNVVIYNIMKLDFVSDESIMVRTALNAVT